MAQPSPDEWSSAGIVVDRWRAWPGGPRCHGGELENGSSLKAQSADEAQDGIFVWKMPTTSVVTR